MAVVKKILKASVPVAAVEFSKPDQLKTRFVLDTGYSGHFQTQGFTDERL